MSDEMLNRGIDLICEGKKEEAARILAKVVQGDPLNDTAWAWLSTCFTEKDRRQYCLDRAIQINPQNQLALDALAEVNAIHADIPKEPPVTTIDFHQQGRSDETRVKSRSQNGRIVSRESSALRSSHSIDADDKRIKEDFPADELSMPEWSVAGQRSMRRRVRRPRPLVNPWLVLLVLFLMVILGGVSAYVAKVVIPSFKNTPRSFYKETQNFLPEAELLMSIGDGANNLSAFKVQEEITAKAFDRMQLIWPEKLAYQKDEMASALLGWSMVGDVADLVEKEGSDCQVDGDLQSRLKNYTGSMAVDKSCTEWVSAVLEIADRHFNMARPGLESYNGD